MSRKSRQRLREAKQRQHKSRFLWIIPVVAIVFIIAGVLAWIYFHHPKSKESITVVTLDPLQPRTLKELLALPPDKIEQCDVGLMDLLCAESLPGAEDLNVQDCLKKLDDWAQQVKRETQRHEYRFNEHPEQLRNSLGYYRMMMLGTVLAQDLGIQYDPDLALPQIDGQRPTLGSGADSKKHIHSWPANWKPLWNVRFNASTGCGDWKAAWISGESCRSKTPSLRPL